MPGSVNKAYLPHWLGLLVAFRAFLLYSIGAAFRAFPYLDIGIAEADRDAPLNLFRMRITPFATPAQKMCCLPMLNMTKKANVNHGKTPLLQRLSGKWADTH